MQEDIAEDLVSLATATPAETYVVSQVTSTIKHLADTNNIITNKVKTLKENNSRITKKK